MTPEWNPDMEQLNKRRVERQARRRASGAKRRRKKMLAMVAVCLVMIALGLGIFFLIRMEVKPSTYSIHILKGRY